jgi:Fur family transcriptional regulator, ferric uptake regulator
MSCSKIIHDKGYRLTPQRMMVLDVLHRTDDHISAEEIFKDVKATYPYANISTVYRTLELLKKLDLITEIDMGDGCIRYHLLEKGHHHHLICNKCGKVVDLPESFLQELKVKLADKYDFEADIKHMAVFGICSDCR